MWLLHDWIWVVAHCDFSLCNTSTTSKQTLLLHAEGKKHKAKARAFHAAKQPPKQAEESAPETKLPTEDTQKDELLDKKCTKEPNSQDPPKSDTEHNKSEADKGNSPLKKKRKLDASAKDDSRKKTKDDTPGDLGDGEVIHSEKAEADEIKSQLKNDTLAEPSSTREDTKQKIKWKKLITSALKSVWILNNITLFMFIYIFSFGCVYISLLSYMFSVCIGDIKLTAGKKRPTSYSPLWGLR